MADTKIDIYEGAVDLTRCCLDDLFDEYYSFLGGLPPVALRTSKQLTHHAA